jgi:hypothetical protein
MGVFSFIQNTKFFMRWVRAFWLFGLFLPLEAKIQNEEWIPFCQKFCMVFSSILQNDKPKPKHFWVKWGTKHTLYMCIMVINIWTNVSSISKERKAAKSIKPHPAATQVLGPVIR